MNTYLTHPSTPVIALLSLVLVPAFMVGTHLAWAVDCVGKPYGYPGCPTRATSSASSSSAGSGFCGNAILEDNEECDKGRFNGKADCSDDCHVLFCGDTVVSKQLGEECEPETMEFYVQDDKGNLTTEVRFTGKECGWYCQPPTCTETGTCSGGCRLQHLDACPAESSGTGAVAGTGTTTLTQVSVSSESVQAHTAAPVCGDATVQTGEECDDGNRVDDDSCTNTCRLPRCGDGIVHKGEECDDGLRNSDIASNACRSNCTVPHCGDGAIDKGEQCDTGSRNSDEQPNACRTSCKAPGCGDGIVDKGEQCDAGTENSSTMSNACRPNCRLPACGDGVVDGVEQCDDANRIDNDSCTNSCKRPGCGDGLVQTGEECDWGTKNSDTQPDSCRLSCTAPRCGDNVVDKNEVCDGVNGCAVDCRKLEATGTGSNSTQSVSTKRPPPTVTHAAAPQNSNFVITLGAILGTAGALLVLASLLFRRQIVAMFSPKGLKSIDDIPLDQIEMPWHKW